METQDVTSINTILPNNQMTIMFFLSILFYMTIVKVQQHPHLHALIPYKIQGV